MVLGQARSFCELVGEGERKKDDERRIKAATMQILSVRGGITHHFTPALLQTQKQLPKQQIQHLPPYEHHTESTHATTCT